VGKNRDSSLRRPRRLHASPPGATKTVTFHSHGHGDCARLHRGQQKQGLFIHTAAATARASTGGNQNRDFSFRRQRRRRESPPGATKTGTFHSDGHGDCARLHRGPQKQGLFIQTAAATARASTGATKTGTFHSDGSTDGASLHRGQQKQKPFIQTATATARVSTGGHKNRGFSFRRPRRLRAPPLGATKTGTFRSDGSGDGARLHWG